MPRAFLFAEMELVDAQGKLITRLIPKATQGGGCRSEVIIAFADRGNDHLNHPLSSHGLRNPVVAIIRMWARNCVLRARAATAKRYRPAWQRGHLLPVHEISKRCSRGRNTETTRTGLEPATSGSTVRGSNQLSYRANGWREKYIHTLETRKAFLRPVFWTNMAQGWSLTIGTA